MLRANPSPSVSSAVAFLEVDAVVFNCFDVSDGPRPPVTLRPKSLSSASFAVEFLEFDADLRLEAIEKLYLQLRNTGATRCGASRIGSVSNPHLDLARG